MSSHVLVWAGKASWATAAVKNRRRKRDGLQDSLGQNW
jgi:hypothetical protein